MNPKDYLMDEIWPLLTDEQKARLVFVASMMAKYPPQDDTDKADTDEQDD